MSELMRESLSALLDDEANELEIERVLSKVADDPELRATWVRYNIVHTVAGGQQPMHLDLDISARVRDELGGQAPPAEST